jgi:galactokinase/mevalonate kinase-like predicted kinase
MTPRAVEATAPCRVDLAGGVAGVLTLTVAIDRRAWCRIEASEDGVVLESRDALRKASARSLSELTGEATLGAVARVLRAVGLETGVRVVTQSRVPEGSGLGESDALAAAVAAAGTRWLGQDADRDSIARLAAEGGPGEAGLREAHTAIRGGALALHPGAGGLRPEPLAVDAARIEESLLLVEGGRSEDAAPADTRLARDAAVRVFDALVGGRLEDVVSLWAEEWEASRRAGWPPAESERVAALVREAGGAARPCGGVVGGLLAVWAPPGARGPGRREAVIAAAKAAGLRLFPARVDVRGLDVE